MRKRCAVIRPAVGKRHLQRHITVGCQFQFGAENRSASCGGETFEGLFAFVITHQAAVVLRHAQAEPPLESSWCAAGNSVPLVPTECLGSLFQYLYRGQCFVRMARIAGLELRDVHPPELDGIESKRLGHFVHHDFPRPLRFLLVVTPGRTGPVRIRPVGAPERSPVRNCGGIQIHLIRRAPRIRSMSAAFQVPATHVNLVIDGSDSAVFFGPDFEFRDCFRFDQELRQFLVFRQHDLHRPAGQLCEVGDQGIEPFCRQPGRSERRAVVFVDEADFGRIHSQS